MIKTRQEIITKIHLIISVLVVLPVSIIYGFSPDAQFDIHLQTTDEHNFFKAIMGLYAGFSFRLCSGGASARRTGARR